MNIFVPDMERQREIWLRGKANVFIHVLVWCIVFVLPVFLVERDKVFQWSEFLIRSLPVIISFLIVFYANYFYFVDKLLLKKKITEFVLVNIAMISAIALLLHLWHEIEYIFHTPLREPPADAPKIPVFVFIFRDIFSLTFVGVLGMVMKATERITQMQSRQKELERAMVEAELKNLKNQINPHFLLNTLNNIYTLSRFNSPKTSIAVMELSELLRYVLYDNDRDLVPLQDEAAFIRNYIDLMKLRLAENVEVSAVIRVAGDSTVKIAPLIFISLIENAFKHGVNNDEPSFVEMELIEKEEGQVYFICRNSYFPKNGSDDRSGSGIGLTQVRKRLDLLYPHRYIWHKELENNIYSTVLIINTLKNDEPHS